MKINIREIAALINGTLSGDSNLDIDNVAKSEDAQNGDLTFLYLPSF